MSVSVAIQSLHFLSENPTPTLKPPSWCAANVSAEKKITLP